MTSGSFHADCVEVARRKLRGPAVGRRAALAALAALGAVPRGAGAQARREVVLANWGGIGNDAQRRHYGGPFEARHAGWRFGTDTSGPSAGRIRSMVESGRVVWDIAESNAATAMELGPMGLLTRVDYSIVDRAKAPVPGFALEYGVASYSFSSVLAWDSHRFPDGPKSWADFWDLRRFPGTRMLRRAPHATLEAAAMAAGAAPNAVFPLDTRAALAKVREIRRNTVYWSSGSESENLLRTGEAVMGQLWHTRAKVLEQETRGRIKWTFAGAVLQPGTYVVLRNAPSGEMAQRLLASMQDPDGQLGLFEALGNGPVNPEAIARVPEDQRRFDPMAAENLPLQCVYDGTWWAANQARVTQEYVDVVTG
jgi:putative spermidine/putrescine transport system substrate-binding protein